MRKFIWVMLIEEYKQCKTCGYLKHACVCGSVRQSAEMPPQRHTAEEELLSAMKNLLYLFEGLFMSGGLLITGQPITLEAIKGKYLAGCSAYNRYMYEKTHLP